MLHHPRRVVSLQGASNFRDLAGYPARDGRPLRWGRVFRSDHLGGLTPQDLQTLAALGLARTMDFRGQAERESAPYRLDGLAQHSLPIEPTVVQGMQALASQPGGLTPQAVAGLMRELYRGFVHDQSHRFAEFFALLLQEDTPLVFHCTAGKDRTGFAAALLLLALGADRELVLQDYLLSNDLYRPPPLPRRSPEREAVAVLWRVQHDFLEAALQAIDGDHGGVDGYLSRRIGLDTAARELLASRLLVCQAPAPRI